MPCWALIRGLCDTGAPEDVEGVGLEVGLLDRPVGLDVGGAGPIPLISSTMGPRFLVHLLISCHSGGHIQKLVPSKFLSYSIKVPVIVLFGM